MSQEQILEVAIKRFSHFGIQKTTLSEIADDLSVSKQSLFYHFADKQAIISAVEEKIVHEYVETVKSETINTPSVYEALEKLLEVRNRFFEKYFMLASQFEWSSLRDTPQSIVDVRTKLRAKEVAIVTDFFSRSVSNGELQTIPSEVTLTLMLEALSAITLALHPKTLLPEECVFSAILNKQKALLHLLYNGIKTSDGNTIAE